MGKFFRIKGTQVVGSFTHANPDNRQLQLVGDGQNNAALCRTVQLGQDDRQSPLLPEGFGQAMAFGRW